MSARDQDPKEVLRRWYADARANGHVEPALQRRCAERATWHVPITVNDHYGVSHACMLRDVSEISLGFRSRARIGEMTGVRIHYLGEPDKYIDGIVIHCSPADGGFDIGVRVVASGNTRDESSGLHE